LVLHACSAAYQPDRFAPHFSRKRATTRRNSDADKRFQFKASGANDCPSVGLDCLWFVHNAALNVIRPLGTAIASALMNNVAGFFYALVFAQQRR
jgi:hypothetical protein